MSTHQEEWTEAYHHHHPITGSQGRAGPGARAHALWPTPTGHHQNPSRQSPGTACMRNGTRPPHLRRRRLGQRCVAWRSTASMRRAGHGPGTGGLRAQVCGTRAFVARAAMRPRACRQAGVGPSTGPPQQRAMMRGRRERQLAATAVGGRATPLGGAAHCGVEARIACAAWLGTVPLPHRSQAQQVAAGALPLALTPEPLEAARRRRRFGSLALLTCGGGVCAGLMPPWVRVLPTMCNPAAGWRVSRGLWCGGASPGACEAWQAWGPDPATTSGSAGRAAAWPPARVARVGPHPSPWPS